MDVLATLGIESNHPGASSGDTWLLENTPTLASINPGTGETLAAIRTADSAQYETIVHNAEKAFHQWRMVPAPKRGEIVGDIGRKIRQHKDALGSLIAMEMGKIKAEGDGEVQEAIDMAEFAVGQSRMLYGKTMHSERPQHRMYEQWHPLGVVGVISAFNFPVAVWSWNAFIAAIAGNTVVWKPSSKVPLCALAIQRICNDVLQAHDCPPVFSTFISQGRELGEKMINDPRLPLVSFTGSCRTGEHVHRVVTQRGGRTLLELGGNNAVIVDETADLKLAVPAIVFGAVGTAGQRCTTTRRLIVHESIVDRLCETLVNAYKQVRIGDPLESKTLMGPLIDSSAVDAYEKAIATIRESGGHILCGGKRLDGPGHFVEPALVRAANHWPIVQKETFAPILYIMSYKHFDDALAIHNEVEQGLSSALFTQNLKHAEAFLSARGSDCGIANINIGTSGAEIGGAFGGEKATGGGREAGSDAWRAYMRRQTNTINWGDALPLAQGIRFDLPTD